MRRGVKTQEFREVTQWIERRLFTRSNGVEVPKRYAYVKFTNGYGSTRPWFTVVYRGYRKEQGGVDHRYDCPFGSCKFCRAASPGEHRVLSQGPMYVLSLGAVTRWGNVPDMP